MSDFNAKIVAIDLAMDAIEHYQRELSDLKAHISFDMRSLFDKLNQEIILTRNEIEGIQDRIDSAQAFIEADMHEGRSDCTTEIGLEELYNKLWLMQGVLQELEQVMIHCSDYGANLLNQFLEIHTTCNNHSEDAIRFMGQYIHDINLISNREAHCLGTYRSATGYYVCVVDSALYPATAEHMLGYRKGEDGNPEIVPEEAAIVQRVFDMYLSGKSTDEISEILQAEKIVIPGKKLTFSKSMIIRMLKNEKYCGDAILQKTVTIDPISKKRKANEGEAPMWLVENSHPAIVTREIFNKAQEESARRKAKAPVSQKSAMTASGKYSKYALTEVMICGECGSRYKRVTWNIRGKRRIVWRCISRLDYGKKYCTESITVDEQALQRAIVRALNRFNVEDEATYLLLMKSTIGEAVGINGSSDEIDLLERRIDALNKRMLDLVSLSVQEGDDAENHEDDFKNISTQIEQLTKRITAIRESESENGDFQARLKEIQDIIDKRRENKDIYDDSIVRQMVECIKVYHDGRLQIILGGGYELEEYLEK